MESLAPVQDRWRGRDRGAAADRRVVTMDQLMVDYSDDPSGSRRGGTDRLQDGPTRRSSTRNSADRLGTIRYEIVYGIRGRVPRRHARNIAPPVGRDDA